MNEGHEIKTTPKETKPVSSDIYKAYLAMSDGYLVINTKKTFKDRKSAKKEAKFLIDQSSAKKEPPQPPVHLESTLIPPEPSPIPLAPEPAPESLPKPDPAPAPDETKQTPPVDPPKLETELNLGIATDDTRIEQEIGGLAQHDRAREKPARGFWRGLLTPITNPREFLRNFVQNTLFKGTFDARSMSFSRSMMEIAREKHAGLDSSIPFEMPQDILDKAIDEGRQMRRKDNPIKRFLYTISDVGSGLTGFYQNSDMVYAKKWFTKNGKSLVDQAKTTSLAEQTQLGERFALEGENDNVISKEVGETRYRLDELIADKPVRDGLQSKIKELVGKYAQGQLNDEELLKEFNQYYHTEVFQKFSADKQKELKGIEVSSNVLKLAEKIKPLYDRYQEENKWDELEFKIYLGRAKYETARGEVRMNKLERKLIHRMVERDYKLSNGLVLNGALETLKDIGIYGGAYALGGTGAAVMFGRSAFHLGGMIVTPLVAAAREGVLVSKKGKLYGLRGKSVTDFEQVSRETAQGRASMDKAKLRPMFEKAMVDQRHANELSQSIVNLLNKESLSPLEEKQLMMAIAHAKARMRLSDLSTQKGKALFDTIGEISVAQNFLGFSEGKQNEEMTGLRASIVQGVAKLSQNNPQLFGQMNQAQAVYEAQLRIGSFQNKLAGVVAKEAGISQADAQTAITNFYEDLGIDTTRGKSLEKTAFILAKVVDKRAATTAAYAAAVSPIIGAELKLISMPLAEIPEIFHEGLGKWSADWGQVIHGQVPLADDHGTLVADLTPAQQASLFVHNTFFAPPLGPAHNEMIDGVQIQLPGSLQHGQLDTNNDGFPDRDGLVDIRTGKVFDMSGYKLAHDANGGVVLTDNNGNVLGGANPEQFAIDELGKFNIKLVQDSALNTSGPESIQNVFNAGAQHDQEILVAGNYVTIKVPNNCNWEQDYTTGKWDLVGTKIDDSRIILVDDADIDSSGNIDTTHANFIDPHVHFGTETGTEVSVSGESGGQEIWQGAGDYRVVHANSENTVAMTNYVVPSEGGGDHPYAVSFRFPDSEVHNPNTGAIEYLHDAANQGRLGILLQVPHFGPNGQDMAIFVPGQQADFDGDGKMDGYEIKFDPTDTDTIINLPNGTTITMASLAQNFLNEGKLAEHGTGHLGSELTWEGRQFFNLANPDGEITHQGRILGGYLDPTSKDYGHAAYNGAFIATHAVHGANPIDLSEVPDQPEPVSISTVTVDNITEKINSTILGYRLEAPPASLRVEIPFIPVPIRENVEKSKPGEPASATPNVIQTPPVVTPPGQTPAPAPMITPEEKKALNEELQGKKKELEEAKDKKDKEKLENEITELEARLTLPEKRKTVSHLSLQQNVLAQAMLSDNDNAVVDYIITVDNKRKHKVNFTEEDYQKLIEKYRTDPKACLAIARLNLLKISKDKQIPSEDEKKERGKRYVDAYLDLMIKLDREAFPASDKVINQVPEYIPDGLSDMGSDPNVDADIRSREKIRVVKKNIFKQSKDLLYELFNTSFSEETTSEQIKTYFVKKIATYVYNEMKYDYQDLIINQIGNASISLDNVRKKELSVCRHHALYTQVLLQSIGLTSRLMKSDVTFGDSNLGAHVNNVVRIENQWYLLDTTNPEFNDKDKFDSIFLRKLTETDINLNSSTPYRWEFRDKKLGKRTYVSRHDMYYRIRNNETNPINN